jgi:hypothetical protein
VISVDSDPKFIETMKNDSFLKTKIDEHKWFPYVYDIGETLRWGIPKRKTPNDSWINYYSKIFNEINTDEIDYILIDGRFRVACFLSSLLVIRHDIPIFFHDFFSRKHYNEVLQFSEIIDQASDLAVLKKHADLDYVKTALTLYNYRHDYR